MSVALVMSWAAPVVMRPNASSLGGAATQENHHPVLELDTAFGGTMRRARGSSKAVSP
jgi:hypothetical protein